MKRMIAKFAFDQTVQWLKKWNRCGMKEKGRQKRNKTEGQSGKVLCLLFSVNKKQIQGSEIKCVLVIRMQGTTIQNFRYGIFLMR